MKAMKKLAALLLALSMVFALAACSSEDNTPSTAPTQPAENSSPAEAGEPAESEPAQDGADISVYTNAYFAPFEYYDGTEIVGVDVDIMNLVGEKLGRQVSYTNVEFGTIIDTVSAGKLADVGAAGITITDSRKEQVDFTTPYFTSVQYVIYPAGTMTPDGTDSDIDTDYILWDSLAGMKIGVQADTTGDIYVDMEINAVDGDDYDLGRDGVLLNSGAEEVRYDSAQLAADAVGAGQVDVVVVDYLPADYIVAKNEGVECMALYYAGGDGEDPSPTREEYAICVTKGQDELLEAINEVLAELGSDGINDLLMKHMGME